MQFLSIYSKALILSPVFSLKLARRSTVESMFGIATIDVTLFIGIGNNLITALVIIPNVPSEPKNNCLTSYPVLSFLKCLSVLMIEPSARTTSSPRTSSLALP